MTHDLLKALRERVLRLCRVFPAVSMKRGGVRFTVTARHSEADIQAFLDALAEHHPSVMEQHGERRRPWIGCSVIPSQTTLSSPTLMETKTA